MYNCKLKFVFFLIVKDEAIFIQETHYRSFPARASQEIDDDIEKPFL